MVIENYKNKADQKGNRIKSMQKYPNKNKAFSYNSPHESDNEIIG